MINRQCNLGIIALRNGYQPFTALDHLHDHTPYLAYPTAASDLRALDSSPFFWQQALTTPPVRAQHSSHLNNTLLCSELLILSILQLGGGGERREGGRGRERRGRERGEREGERGEAARGRERGEGREREGERGGGGGSERGEREGEREGERGEGQRRGEAVRGREVAGEGKGGREDQRKGLDVHFTEFNVTYLPSPVQSSECSKMCASMCAKNETEIQHLYIITLPLSLACILSLPPSHGSARVVVVLLVHQSIFDIPCIPL